MAADARLAPYIARALAARVGVNSIPELELQLNSNFQFQFRNWNWNWWNWKWKWNWNTWNWNRKPELNFLQLLPQDLLVNQPFPNISFNRGGHNLPGDQPWCHVIITIETDGINDNNFIYHNMYLVIIIIINFAEDLKGHFWNWGWIWNLWNWNWKKPPELELELKLIGVVELELELKIRELELELNWKNGIDPNPVSSHDIDLVEPRYLSPRTLRVMEF